MNLRWWGLFWCLEDTMKDMKKMLSLWGGNELDFATHAGAVSFPSISKPMYVQYVDSVGGDLSVSIPSFLQQHKCYGAGRSVDNGIYAVYAGAWEFPFKLYTGSNGVLYPADAYFTFKEMKTLCKVRALFGEGDEVTKLHLKINYKGKASMDLVTKNGRDCEPLENLVQVYAGVEPPALDSLDADHEGWDGVGRFR